MSCKFFLFVLIVDAHHNHRFTMVVLKEMMENSALFNFLMILYDNNILIFCYCAEIIHDEL